METASRIAAARKALEWAAVPMRPVGPQARATDLPTMQEVAEQAGINRSTLNDAKLILGNATPEEIGQIKAGKMGLHRLANQLRRRLSPGERKQERETPHPTVVAMLERQTLTADLWNRLRSAMDGLNGLPLPAEVAELIRRHPKRAGTVDANLARALKWLKEFSDEWGRGHSAAP